MCPMYLGVKAVIAKSFERIHRANLINFGILPMVFRDRNDFDSLQPDDRLSAENLAPICGGGRLDPRPQRALWRND